MRTFSTGIILLNLQVAAMIAAAFLNFNEAWFGHPVVPRNIVVSLTYIAVWIAVLAVGYKKAGAKILVYSMVYWSVSLLQD